MNHFLSASCSCVLALTAAATAQSGRTLSLGAPVVAGRTAVFELHHPATAAGNVYALLWSEAFAQTNVFAVPGFSTVGTLRVNPATWAVAYLGLCTSSGLVTHAFQVPSDPFFLGYAFDMQSLDIDVANLTLNLSDDELTLVITNDIGGIDVAIATTSSTTTGNNDLHSITDLNLGNPASKAIAPFSYLVARHRGEEGFVEGYAGTFSGTSHNSDIDSVGYRRAGRRTANPGYQVLACPNGYDVSIVRDRANGRQFSLLSYDRATGDAVIIPGSTWLDTGTSATPAQQFFYYGVSRDGQWAALYVRDSNTASPAFAPMVWAFRTDGTQPVVDVTPPGISTSDAWFDGTLLFTNDFLIASGSRGYFWTSATAPAPMTALMTPNTTASNLPNIWAYPFSWRVSPDGATAYVPLGSDATASRGEMDMCRIANVGGVPVATNHSQFAVATGIAEFGYNGYTPATTNNSSVGIKASVSPDGSKIAFLAATTTTSAFPGLYVADGTPGPTLRTAPGATYYSEVAFVNDTTVMFFAGASNTTQDLYRLDVPTGTVTAVTTVADIRTRGQFWSLNKDWWYFVRSNAASDRNDLVGVDCATGVPFSVTGGEFGAPGPVGTIRTGSFNTTADPWFALEMQLRRAPVGGYAYFTARRETGVAATFADANVFRFDIENGGRAVQLTNNTGTGAAAAIVNIENLTISGDGQHVAWTQRIGTSTAASEDVFHLDLGTNTVTQASTSNPTGQTVSDGSLRFVGNAPRGLVFAIGTGSTTVPVANAKVEYTPLGTTTPILISQPPAGTRLYHVVGAHD